MVLLKSLALAGLAATVAAKSAVLDLIPSNFDDVVLKSGKPTLVEFFAPWCGHCKNLAPVYEELARSFHFAKDKIQIAKVDADAEKALGQRFGVQGFPTLKFFDGKSKTPEDYNRGRDIHSLKAFITEKTGVKPKKTAAKPSSVVMLTDSNFASEIGGDKHVLVAFTAPWCGHCKNLAPTWEDVAAAFANEPSVVVAKVDADAPTGKATAAKYDVKSYPTLIFFEKGSDKSEPYNGGRTESDLIEFLNQKAGTFRTPGGGLNSQAGSVAALDDLVKRFVDGAGLTELAAEVKEAAEGLKADAQHKYAVYYVKVFDKLTADDSYARKEFARLDGILKKGGLAPEKVDDMTSKRNILDKFLQTVAPSGEKASTEKDEL